jgi:hypothetical protein
LQIRPRLDAHGSTTLAGLAPLDVGDWRIESLSSRRGKATVSCVGAGAAGHRAGPKGPACPARVG